jgi:hypothetical protein
MSDAQRIRWTWIIVGGLLAEITVIAVFFFCCSRRWRQVFPRSRS